MKKSKKIILTISAVTLTAGVLLTGIGYMKGGRFGFVFSDGKFISADSIEEEKQPFILEKKKLDSVKDIDINILSYADIRIPYYSNESNAVITLKESISQLDASAYNMEGGEMVRTKMKRDLVFTERINKQYMQLKFSIPAVREGTVFEYKYQLSSDLYYSINLWEAQRDIPVIFTQYDITIPEYFKFNLDMRGPHPMASKDETSSLTFLLSLPGGQTEMLSCNGRHMIFTGEHLPALRPDNYVWCANDYMSSVYFELRGVDFPGSFYRSFTHTWEEIDQMLLQDEDFGAMLKMRNPNSVKICTILDKPSRRKADIAPDYEGFAVPDEFVVGYGLDYDEKYRNLPYIGVLKPSVYEK